MSAQPAVPVSAPHIPARQRSIQPEHLLELTPLRAITQLAAPTTLVMLIAATSNVLYTYYVSRLGADAIAAVSLVFPISLLAITAMGGGIGAGASSAIARTLGAGQRRAATAVAEHALLLSVGLGLGFGAAIWIGGRGLFRLMGGTGAVLDSATVFARVLFGGAAITFTAAMLDSVMRGEGNVRVPALWSSGSLILQIALTPVCMFVAGLGLIGAPIATLTSQLIAILPRARYVFGGRGVVQPAPWPATVSAAPLREILRVGVPASLSTLINYVGMMILTGVLARLGTAHLAAYGLGTRLDFLLMSLSYGFGAAVLTLVGLATGARRPQLANVYVVRAAAIVVVLLAALGGLLCWRPSLWLGIFTQDADILAVGGSYFRIIGLSYPCVGASMVMAFAFQGLGRATPPLVWMSVRVAGILAVALLCTQVLGLREQAVFVTIAAGNVTSALVLTGLFVRTQRRHRHGSRPTRS